MAPIIDVYVEVGSRRAFAAALDWPGWCRIGRDETTALQALWACGPRYARTLEPAQLGFEAPGELSDLLVVERLTGTATTDFGAPAMAPTGDAQPLDDNELQRHQTLLQACWHAFDAAAALASGKTLRAGPRGGGRTLDGIAQHVRDAERSYLSQLGGKAPPPAPSPWSSEPTRQAILKTLDASAHGEIAPFGPRGGKRWSPRYFVRRAAWHVLDHTWEIEDRLADHPVSVASP